MSGFFIFFLINSLIFQNSYNWHIGDINRQISDIKAPIGFYRVDKPKKSFANWLRALPLKNRGAKVYYYNKILKPNQNLHYAVIDIDIGKRDLQQCADAVMRLRAEYLYSLKKYKKIAFDFTSGDNLSFFDWSIGKRAKIVKNRVKWVFNGKKGVDYENFRKYMNLIFTYAGTYSLAKETPKKNIKKMEIGNFFIKGGFPGHAIIVVDMVENKKGQKLYLLAQSYMPAQSIHILKNFNSKLSPWYKLDNRDNIITPEWNFKKNQLHKFKQ